MPGPEDAVWKLGCRPSIQISSMQHILKMFKCNETNMPYRYSYIFVLLIGKHENSFKSSYLVLCIPWCFFRMTKVNESLDKNSNIWWCNVMWQAMFSFEDFLTLVLLRIRLRIRIFTGDMSNDIHSPGLNLDTPYLCKQCRSRSVCSEEANWSRSALFVIQYVNLYQQPGLSNLIGWQLEVGVAS